MNNSNRDGTQRLVRRTMFAFGLLGLANLSGSRADEPTRAPDGSGRIIIQTHSDLPKPPDFYTASAKSTVRVGSERIEQEITMAIRIVQGEAKTLSFGLNGEGSVIDVQGDNITSWSVRQAGRERFVDLHPKQDVRELNPTIRIRSTGLRLPATINLTHLTPGKSVGFDSMVRLEYAAGVNGTVTAVDGFVPLGPGEGATQFQTTTGGTIQLRLNRDGVLRAVELSDTTLEGELHPNGKSIRFRLRATAHVSEGGAEITILSGNAAASNVPSDQGYRLRLAIENGQPVYNVSFPEVGTFPLTLDFVATLNAPQANWQSMDFTVAAGAVVPVRLKGLDEDLEFHRDQHSMMPRRDEEDWVGFLPATGRARLRWKAARNTGEGKLFFATTARVEVKVGAGLLRQEHQIDYQVLQGELASIRVNLAGPGEILEVQGKNIVAWKVTGDGDDRQLEVTLSQPISASHQIKIRSQTPLGAFPVRVEGLRLNPIGAIRHSGYLRLTNSGAVRVEPTGLQGLTQLAPDQFPGEASQARQNFVYRFPAADHQFTVIGYRIQPEVNIAQLVLYELADTDRVIRADIELDIREAPIREWDFGIPSDYSVVSVTGASVADYIASAEVVDDRRKLKVIYGQDVAGRQLVTLHLEKNEAATAGDWVLPQIDYLDAKTVRGDIGIIGAPGFRIAVKETSLLVEKPLSYFPKPAANLQQAFRIREPGWSATMAVERLERSVQSDVFHLFSLSQETIYGSALINYFVTGAPVSEWRVTVPEALGNVMVDGQDVRTWRREGDTLIVSLHQGVMGAYTLLVTFEEKPDTSQGTFQAGLVEPLGVNSERGFIQVVSPQQVEITTLEASEGLLKLEPLELPAEFRLLSTAPSLGTWQYTERPFDLNLKVNWFEPGITVPQVVEFSEANSHVSQDGELVTDILYYVKSRGQRSLKLQLPADPVRLWEASINGQPVTARQTDEATLIPLPGGLDPNVPIAVRLRLGKPVVDESRPKLTLPIVDAPVLKTQWNIVGDERRVLVPARGTVSPPVPVRRPSGFDWVAKRALAPLIGIAVLVALGAWSSRQAGGWRPVGLLAVVISIVAAGITATEALSQMGSPAPLQLTLPIMTAGETVELQVGNVPLWRVNYSPLGLALVFLGAVAIVASFLTRAWTVRSESDQPEAGPSAQPSETPPPGVIRDPMDFGRYKIPIRAAGMFLIGLGILFHRDGASSFFALLALAIFWLVLLPAAAEVLRRLPATLREAAERRKARKAASQHSEDSVADEGPGGSGAIVTTILLTMVVLGTFSEPAFAAPSDWFATADSLSQQWHISHTDARLKASGKITVTGKPGDRFLLLKAPAVLTRFEGSGLRLTKTEIPGLGLAYVMGIPDAPAEPEAEPGSESTGATPAATEFNATFDYQLEALQPIQGMPVLTGLAAVHEIDVRYSEPGWAVTSPNAVRIETVESDAGSSQAKVLLRPGDAILVLKPRARDVTTEQTQFFVEASNLYLPGPGVVDGRHRLFVRTSQGQVGALTVQVPPGLTVSAVEGPVGSWQFDADSGRLQLEIEPAQSGTFDVSIDTQRSLDPLPVDVKLAPLTVANAHGQVGLLAIAFGPDAQPEGTVPAMMSAVNLGDFDAGLLPNEETTLHRVYRYGAEGGELALSVAPVDPEVRVVSKQVLSLGDERIVMGINFATDISRAGLFQFSFLLPEGLEVESLTGPALHHWSEVSENDQRRIILHLNGKTIGTQNFSLTLAGPSPATVESWSVPRFQLQEATRQTGELVVRPTTGIRLQALSRQNVSETDPRSLGGKAQGSLAFRLLQRDWQLELGIEKLEPWVTGQVLHEVTLREGQTRSALMAHFHVQNASIRRLQVVLPITNPDEIKTLRATGNVVSDFVRTAANSNIWEVQFERRIVGSLNFRIEYERRGDRENESETLSPAEFPQARQLSYYYSVHTGGRLEIKAETMPRGWQQVDWNSVPQVLREAGNRNAPALALRVVAPQSPLTIQATRHSVADALKLRVTKGILTTVLSASGDQLTAVDVTIEVIQRSSLSVGLPGGSELFSIFVNGESVNSIRKGGDRNAWQFYILPGIDDRTATVRFVYSVKDNRVSHLKLVSPQLNVPLENIEWNVVAPKGFELTEHDGNLELVRRKNADNYDRESYLSKVSGKRQQQAQQAAQLLEQANQLIQAGEQTKARWALNSVANQYALDAASNEDARVQLENLQTQQAIVGLNTRRQRLYLDNDATNAAVIDNQQLREAAAENPILQQDQLNFRPQQLSQLLRGNTLEDNQVLQQIAARLVQHQRTTEPAAQAIIISLPEEGSVYSFSRSVQVAENAPLELDLNFAAERRIDLWRTAVVLVLLAIVAVTLVYFVQESRDRASTIQGIA